MGFKLPLMNDNISREDLNAVCDFLSGMPRLTQSEKVAAFERSWSEWLGVKYSVFVSSGAAANLATITAFKHIKGPGEIIVPPLTWVSDISALIWNGFTPVFADINLNTLCMDEDQILSKITERTRAVFMTHIMGFNGLSQRLLDELASRGIELIEDVCESHGATFKGGRLGSFGYASNFSFYFAHHMSTIEGGMVCTNNEEMFNTVRMLRSHGMTREAPDATLRHTYENQNPELSPDFIFAFPAFNLRSTELNAVIGLEQLKRLDKNIEIRQRNFALFLKNLNPSKYRTDFATEGSSNYAFNLVLRTGDMVLRDAVESELRNNGIEFRRGSSGGGNQLRQPYLKGIVPDGCWKDYPNAEFIHHFAWYIGNYPTLNEDLILWLCDVVNAIGH